MVNMFKILMAAIVFIAIVGIAVLGKRLARLFIFKSASAHAESTWLEVVSMLLAIGISIGEYAKTEPVVTWWMWTGALMVIIGGVIQCFAKKYLGDFKTFEDKLTESFRDVTGLYKKIRHPSKLALVLMLTGFVLALGSKWGILMVIIFYYPSLLYHISQEDRALEDQFGQRYVEYKTESKRIIPWIL